MVANKFLEEVELDDEVRVQVVIMCKHFHESVRLMSERYYEMLRRRNYVTPTSYLELIMTFKTVLGKKRQEILQLKNRYATGLEKLNFAASQVGFHRCYDPLSHDNLYSGVIVTQLLRDRFTIDRPRAEWRMQFLNEKAPLAALHITRRPMAVQGL